MLPQKLYKIYVATRNQEKAPCNIQQFFFAYVEGMPNIIIKISLHHSDLAITTCCLKMCCYFK